MESSTKMLSLSYLNRENVLENTREITLEENSSTVHDLQNAVDNAFGISSNDYKLYHGLKHLDNLENNLSQLGIKSGSKLYVIQNKLPDPIKKCESVEMTELQNACHGLHALFGVAHKSRVGKSQIAEIAEDPEWLQSIVSSVEGLAEDQTAIDILQNVKLLEVMVDPKNTKKILKKHPCLAAAFVIIWQSMESSSILPYNSGLDNSGAGTSTSRPTAMDSSNSGTPQSTSGEARRSNVITSSQLADALAQAITPSTTSGSLFPPYNSGASTGATSSQSSTPQSGGARSNPPLITRDAFSQAMQQALMSTGLQEVTQSLRNDGQASTPQVSEELIQSGLEQIRAMGITDDQASRDALTATNGNVEAAINILFGGSDTT